MNRLLQIGLSLGISLSLYGVSLNHAFNELKENRYGFAFVDVGVSEEDLTHFQRLDIQREWIYHHFGELDELPNVISDFICEMGENERALASQIAAQLTQIVHEVIEVSGKQTAWVNLQSFIPTNIYDLPRWHWDGYFYAPEGPDELLCKFAMTFVGPPTLFYLLPPELRQTAARHLQNRHYMHRFCQEENIVSAKAGEGAIFLGGQGAGVSALHSAPPIHENRFFFSIVPCSESQLPSLQKRVLAVYPKDSRH